MAEELSLAYDRRIETAVDGQDCVGETSAAAATPTDEHVATAGAVDATGSSSGASPASADSHGDAGQAASAPRSAPTLSADAPAWTPSWARS